jgi:hypothetical protein
MEKEIINILILMALSLKNIKQNKKTKKSFVTKSISICENMAFKNKISLKK